MFDRKAYMHEYMKKYRQTEKHKKQKNAYRQTEAYKERYMKKRKELFEKKMKGIVDPIDEEKIERQKEYGRRYRAKNRAELTKKSVYDEVHKFNNVHTKCKRFIRKYNLRPKVCPICGLEGNIISHHTDYNYWNKVVFCCISCHTYIHNGRLQCPEPVDLLELSDTR